MKLDFCMNKEGSSAFSSLVKEVSLGKGPKRKTLSILYSESERCTASVRRTVSTKGRWLCYYIVMLNHIHNIKYLRPIRKTLRKNMTEEEVILWSVLKNNNWGYKFRRQHSIDHFVADFFCPLKRLIIELDGSQHLDNKEADQERTNYFESLGIKVIRFWNNEVKNNLNGVMIKIVEELGK